MNAKSQASNERKPRRLGAKAPHGGTVPVRLEVPVTVYRSASRLTGAYTLLSLGQVLERWVEDAAYGARQLDSWENKQVTRWLRGHPFPKKMRPRPRHRARRSREEDGL